MRYLLIAFFIIFLGIVWYFQTKSESGLAINSVPLEQSVAETPVEEGGASPVQSVLSNRQVFIAERINLPLAGSAPTENVQHSIPIEEIRQGCFRQDCIPSVDEPEFVSVREASDILPDDTIGIGLSYKGVDRFYPFNMLVTREIVNDVVAGDPLLITYCPLCGTGIVFDRTVAGEVFEFGVSGMLWQSNLLMYNRASSLPERNLWSQVLGEAVVGNMTGTKLTIVPSDIVRYSDWRETHSNGQVLNTGRIGDPYGGDYYEVARNFAPNFNEATSILDPSAYVYGVEVEGLYKAYPRAELPVGVTTDTIGTVTITLTKNEQGEVSIVDADGQTISDIEGFWFSWISAHPETDVWSVTNE